MFIESNPSYFVSFNNFQNRSQSLKVVWIWKLEFKITLQSANFSREIEVLQSRAHDKRVLTDIFPSIFYIFFFIL